MRPNKMNEDEIQILGTSNKKKPNIYLILASIVGLLIIFIVLGLYIYKNTTHEIEQYNSISVDEEPIDSKRTSYVEVLEETVNDVPLFVYVPHNAKVELATIRPSMNDSTIIFATQAADISAENGNIIGDFIQEGKEISRGKGKLGFCSIINNEVSIGATTSTALYDKAIANKGYFFRQYALVSNGQLIENKPKGKAIRRAIGVRNNTTIIVESRSRESFYDFSQALLDIGVLDAIYLVGGHNVYRWYVDIEGNNNISGNLDNELTGSINYIVWRK